MIKVKKILAIMFVMCMITACTPTEPTVNDEPLVPTEDVKIINKAKEDKNLDNFELLGQQTVEIDGIEKETSISLYTSAMRDKKGELMWDDTQEWVLRAETAFGNYILYDERTNGRAYIKVFNSYNDDGDEIIINLHIYANTYNEIREYSFNGEAFEERIRYTTDDTSKQGISELYSSIPQYK